MKPRTPSLTRPEALMTVAMLAMDSDDCYSHYELRRLHALANSHPLFRGIHSVDGFLGRRFADLRKRGQRTLLNEVRKVLDQSLQATAYAWAVDVVSADGEVVGKEYRFLEELAGALELPKFQEYKIQAAISRRLLG